MFSEISKTIVLYILSGLTGVSIVGLFVTDNIIGAGAGFFLWTTILGIIGTVAVAVSLLRELRDKTTS